MRVLVLWNISLLQEARQAARFSTVVEAERGVIEPRLGFQYRRKATA
jgi:hypothetical protein